MRYRLRRVIGGKGEKPGQWLKTLRGICVDAAGRLYAVGDSELRIFDGAGKLLRRWKTDRPGHCVAVNREGEIHVGEYRQIEKFDRDGKVIDVFRDPPRLGLVTSVVTVTPARSETSSEARSGSLLVGDATRRCVHRYDLSGKLINEIGKDNPTHGFVIPNGRVDFVLDPNDAIHVANPGKFRVERYSLEGKLLGRFGKFSGRAPEGFTGCCNPTNVALMADGHFVVTVKAPPAVKIYDAEGKLVEVVDADFDPNAKNMDVAVDASARIFVADTARLHVAVLEPQPKGADVPEETTVPGGKKQ